MEIKLTDKMIEQIQQILKHGNRVELVIEQGRVTIIEIRRKLRMKG